MDRVQDFSSLFSSLSPVSDLFIVATGGTLFISAQELLAALGGSRFFHNYQASRNVSPRCNGVVCERREPVMDVM